jgi:alpha-glucosidase
MAIFMNTVTEHRLSVCRDRGLFPFRGSQIVLFLALCCQLVEADEGKVGLVVPPHQGFYAKFLDYEGIPIRASKEVSDEALFEARRRLERLMKNQPNVRFNMKKAGAELHIIGKDQVTSDLPEFRDMKGKPFDGKQTIDERTRGLGGLMTSCGEENLLHLKGDRYWDRDICLHEFSHNIYEHGVSREFRRTWKRQMKASQEKGLWVGAYAGKNDSEFFAELTMWYFGTRGDHGMKGRKPGNGPEGLREYDPDAFKIMDDFYSGRIEIPKL